MRWGWACARRSATRSRLEFPPLLRFRARRARAECAERLAPCPGLRVSRAATIERSQNRPATP